MRNGVSDPGEEQENGNICKTDKIFDVFFVFTDIFVLLMLDNQVLCDKIKTIFNMQITHITES